MGFGPHPYGNIKRILIFITFYYADIDKKKFHLRFTYISSTNSGSKNLKSLTINWFNDNYLISLKMLFTNPTLTGATQTSWPILIKYRKKESYFVIYQQFLATIAALYNNITTSRQILAIQILKNND